jgi:mRNA interferase MazF
MAITSRLHSTANVGVGEIVINGWEGAGLLKSSAVKPVFATIEQKLIVKTLGRLQPADISALRTAIFALLC